jgi:hypothetical protein
VDPTLSDVPPYGDGDGLCPYRLIIQDGTYDRKADTVTWDEASEVMLIDYTQGVPCSYDPSDPSCIDSYQVGSGPLSFQGIMAAFGTGGGEDPDPEPARSWPLRRRLCGESTWCC